MNKTCLNFKGLAVDLGRMYKTYWKEIGTMSLISFGAAVLPMAIDQIRCELWRRQFKRNATKNTELTEKEEEE